MHTHIRPMSHTGSTSDDRAPSQTGAFLTYLSLSLARTDTHQLIPVRSSIFISRWLCLVDDSDVPSLVALLKKDTEDATAPAVISDLSSFIWLLLPIDPCDSSFRSDCWKQLHGRHWPQRHTACLTFSGLWLVITDGSRWPFRGINPARPALRHTTPRKIAAYLPTSHMHVCYLAMRVEFWKVLLPVSVSELLHLHLQCMRSVHLHPTASSANKPPASSGVEYSYLCSPLHGLARHRPLRPRPLYCLTKLGNLELVAYILCFGRCLQLIDRDFLSSVVSGGHACASLLTDGFTDVFVVILLLRIASTCLERNGNLVGTYFRTIEINSFSGQFVYGYQAKLLPYMS